MSTIDRPLHADVLRFDLDREEREATHPDILERDGRSSRTLLKDGHLRVTLIVLGPDGDVPGHVAPGPITVQPLRGEVVVRVDDGDEHTVGPNEILAIGPAVPHSVRSTDGAAFLLTVSHPS